MEDGVSDTMTNRKEFTGVRIIYTGPEKCGSGQSGPTNLVLVPLDLAKGLGSCSFPRRNMIQIVSMKSGDQAGRVGVIVVFSL